MRQDILPVIDSETIIVVAGDVVHAKLDMSPELVQETSDFLTMLADLAPTFVIAGNHDLNLSNKSRMDTLSPIVSILNHKNITYWKHSGIYPVGDVEFVVYSIVDTKDKWPSVVPNGKTRIGVYHGPVYGAATNNNFTITDRHTEVSQFDGLDIVILGDIHTYQSLQSYDATLKKPEIVYSSSLLQQNHGELSTGHGWVLWNVDKRTHVFNELKNEYGYRTIDISDGTVPSIVDLPKYTRLRIITGNTDSAVIDKLLAVIKSKHTIVELSTLKGSTTQGQFTKGATTIELDKITQLDTQTTLLKDWLADHIPECVNDDLKKVVDIHSELYTKLKLDDKSRNVQWKPIKFKFSNMFSYGPDNEINFDNMSGVWGVFAPNASGKSSIMDAVMFCLYDKTPRAYRGDHIMNNRKTTFSCELTFKINEDTFTVARSGKKNKAGEVKVDVDFFKTDKDNVVTSLNGTERRVTNTNIRDYVGTYEDFVLTAFSSQNGSSLFVDKTHSERKDLLCQFMGLDVFDQLHELANDTSRDMIAMLKKHKTTDNSSTLVSLQTQIETEVENLIDIESKLESEYNVLNSYIIEKEELISKKIAIDPTIIDADKLVSVELKIHSDINDITTKIDRNKSSQSVVESKIQELNGYIDIINEIPDVQTKALEYESAVLEKNSLIREVETINKQIVYCKHTIDVLGGLKCNYECDVCLDNNKKFIDDAEKSKLELQEAISKLDTFNNSIESSNKLIETLTIAHVSYSKLIDYQKIIDSETSNLLKLQMEHQTLSLTLDKLYDNARKIIDAKAMYDKNKEDILHNKEIDQSLDNLTQDINTTKDKLAKLNPVKMQYHGNHKVLLSKKEDILATIKEIGELEDKCNAYQAYLAAVGRNGITHTFLINAIPIIEQEVNNILSQVAEFTINLELDGKNVNGTIQYSNDRRWQLESGSGMERFISGLAIRVALMNASNLPKPAMIVIDEGFGALDQDNLHNMTIFLTLLRDKFNLVFIISHLDSARDMVDNILEITQADGYSSIIKN